MVQGILNFLANPFPPKEEGEKLAHCMFWTLQAPVIFFFLLFFKDTFVPLHPGTPLGPGGPSWPGRP